MKTQFTMPRFVVVSVAAALVSLMFSIGLIWWIHEANEAEQRRECERAVSNREDGRAMWVYLVDTYSGNDQERVDAFVAELNQRLPSLRCEHGGSLPVPVEVTP